MTQQYPKQKYQLKNKISFGSFVKITRKTKNFLNFDKYWINKKDVLSIKKNKFTFFKNKNF